MGISNPVPGASLQVFREQVKWGRRHARDGLLPRHGGEDNWHGAHHHGEGANTTPRLQDVPKELRVTRVMS